MRFFAVVLFLLATAAAAQEAPAAAERARIANERIAAEVERRRQEEARTSMGAREIAPADDGAQAEEIAPAGPVQTIRPGIVIDDDPPAASKRPVPPRPPADSGTGQNAMSAALAQVQTLGEMRDAGYLSADEFERLKQKILADVLDPSD